MSFLGAAFLWALPLMSVPVIIHLLHRRQQEVVRWGAMQFLVEATAQRRKFWRIEDLLLMLLRMAVVLAFILALSQPLVRSSWFGGHVPRDVILVFDTSMSTSQLDGEESLFDKQLAAADEFIRRLDDGDVLRVLQASTVPEWVVSEPMPVSADVKNNLRSRLEQLEPTLADADMMQCLQTAAEAESADDLATRVIVLVTDGQANAWRTESVAAWGSFEKESLRVANVVVNVIRVGDAKREKRNVCVTALGAPRAVVGLNQAVTFSAKVSNTGDLDTGATLTLWTQDEASLGASSLPALSAGEDTAVHMTHAFDAVGVYEITCTIKAADDLELDDVGRFVVEVVDDVSVLFVDGDLYAPPVESETACMLAALGHGTTVDESGWKSVFNPTVIGPGDLAEQDLQNFRCVVLADAGRLDAKAVTSLKEYVAAGGGLWIILGQHTDRTFFNDVMAKRELSPLRVAEPVGDLRDEEHFEDLRPPAEQHPATMLLADTERLDIDRIQVRRRHPFEPSEDMDEVSILLSTLDGEPLVVEQVLEKGRIIVQGVPMNLRWSNWPVSLSFVVMVHEWLWYLAEPGMPRWNIEPGETMIVATDAPVGSVEVLTPRGVKTTASGEASGKRSVYRFADTRVPGTYLMEISRSDAEVDVVPFHVERNPAESDLGVLSEDDVNVLTASAGLRFDGDPLAMPRRRTTSASPKEPVWAWLLAAILALMLAESLLAGRMTRRRSVQTPGLTLE